MTAKEYIDKYVKKRYQKLFSVYAHILNGRSWYHVHRDEEIPEDEKVSLCIPDYNK